MRIRAEKRRDSELNHELIWASIGTLVLLGAVLLTIRKKHLWAVAFLALAMGAKLWPLALLPLVLRPILAKPGRLLLALLIFGLLAGAMFLPLYAAGVTPDSGFLAYGRRWEMNDALFMLFLWGSKLLLGAVRLEPGHGQLMARVIVLAIVVACIVWLSRRSLTSGADFCGRCLLVVAAVFLLSPTQFPWYFVWLVPFLAIRPRMSLLLFTVLLPLYYLRFYFDARGLKGVFDNGIVWLEYVPVWFMLIWEWSMSRKRRPSSLHGAWRS